MAKPVVDGLEKKLNGRLDFARIDVGEERGAEVASELGITMVPAFVIVDASGKVIYRKLGGRPDGDAIEALLAAPSR